MKKKPIKTAKPSPLIDKLGKLLNGIDEFVIIAMQGDRIAAAAKGDPSTLWRELAKVILTTDQTNQQEAATLESFVHALNHISGLTLMEIKLQRGETTIAEVDRIAETFEGIGNSQGPTVH